MKNSTRQTITFLIIVLALAACTPASTPPVDTVQEEQAPTLILSATETPLPTKTLTPTATSIPPTPTFPAPEGADLPDSAVRITNEQGQEVILDRPGGYVLWALVENEKGELSWENALDYAQAIPVALSKADFASAAEMSQAAIDNKSMEAAEVFADWWQPVLERQVMYPDHTWEQAQAQMAEFVVNQEGRAVLLNAEGEVLLKEGRPEESGLEWYAAPQILIANLVDTDQQPLADSLAKVRQRMDEFLGGLKLGRFNLYAFFSIVDRIVPLDEDFKLETGEAITHLLRFFFYKDGMLKIDGGGSTQVGYTPFFAYDEAEREFYLLGAGITRRKTDSEFEESLDNVLRWERDYGNGPATFGGRPNEFPIGPGQVISIGFGANPSTSLTRSTEGFWDDPIAVYHSPEEFATFAESGDLSAIELEVPGVGKVLLPQDVLTSHAHALVDVQAAEAED